MLSDVISKTYEDLKRGAEERSKWQKTVEYRQDFGFGAYRGAKGARRRRHRGRWGAEMGCPHSPPGTGLGRRLGWGCAPPQKMFDYLVMKWCILMHISSILTYLF